MHNTPKTDIAKPKRLPPAGFHGKPGRSGPPKDNRNAIRHGLRAGKLPADCAYLENRLNAFRRILEDAVMATRGKVTMTDAANIQTCLRWERHSALAQRWMTIKQGDLKPLELLKFSEAIASASDKRDKALAALRLDRDTQTDIIATLYRQLPNGDANGPAPTTN